MQVKIAAVINQNLHESLSHDDDDDDEDPKAKLTCTFLHACVQIFSLMALSYSL